MAVVPCISCHDCVITLRDAEVHLDRVLHLVFGNVINTGLLWAVGHISASQSTVALQPDAAGNGERSELVC